MTRNQMAILEATAGAIGLGLFWWATSFFAALGLFVCLFANNIGHSRNV